MNGAQVKGGQLSGGRGVMLLSEGLKSGGQLSASHMSRCKVNEI